MYLQNPEYQSSLRRRPQGGRYRVGAVYVRDVDVTAFACRRNSDETQNQRYTGVIDAV